MYQIDITIQLTFEKGDEEIYISRLIDENTPQKILERTAPIAKALADAAGGHAIWIQEDDDPTSPCYYDQYIIYTSNLQTAKVYVTGDIREYQQYVEEDSNSAILIGSPIESPQ